jgi:hypothetical protein
MARKSAFSEVSKWFARMAVAASLAGAAFLLVAAPAQALPSFARQTGQECAACHNGFPELTPYGRLFKLNGYTFQGGTSALPPLAVMAIPSFTHTQADQPGGAAPHFGPNDNFAFTGSLFYGGGITANLGAFAQVTYDEVARRVAWDNTDIRYARAVNLGGRELVLGATLNNNPSVSDVWNTTPAWRFPFVSSSLAPTPAAATLIEGGLAQQVAGAGAYAFWNRLVYAELDLYRTLSPRTLTTLGIPAAGTSAIKGVAPYWRLALEPSFGQNTIEVGTFGMAASLVPQRTTGSGTDHLVDVGVDTQYQYLGAQHSLSLQASWIFENQSLSASEALGLAANPRNHLRSLNAKATYYYDQTYGATLGYFNVNGTSDPLLFGSSAIGSPNSYGLIGELDYIPFAHGGPSFWPWFNLKLGLQYVWYQKFNGARNDFDGAGRNARDNNTLFAFAWLSF